MRALMNLGRIAREQSSFKVLFTIMFVFGLEGGLFALFFEGFTFLDTLGGVGLILIYRLFALFFFGLAVMLALSSVITSYTSFFRSDELPYLLLQPLKVESIVFYKFLESTLYASWAFFFVILPFVGAYAWHEGLSIFFSLWTFLFAVPFVLLCCALGTVISLLLVRWFPRGRILVGAVFVLSVLGAWVGWHMIGGDLGVGDDTTLILKRLVPGLRISSYPLWPSWWVSEGIMALSREQWQRGLMFLGVLVANLLVVLLLVESVGRACFYDGWEKVSCSTGGRKRRGVLLGLVERMLKFMPLDLRAIVVKDLRLFLREPAQWSQALFFFGLLGLYFLNLRNLNYHTLPMQWRNLITFLNVFSVSAVMASFGCRFVFPQLSLEGHSFWILGLSPSSMGRILMAKFGLALVVMLAVSVGLMLICVNMLEIEAFARWASLGMAVAISFAIAGLSTGLGAVFRDLKQRNPAAIVSGFGGTLNLVLSLGFIMVTMLPFGLVFHLHDQGGLGAGALALASAWLILVTVVITTVPLVLGRRSLECGEY